MTQVIEFEGIDGVGKTTAYTYFIEQLKSRGFKVLETREVGNPHIPVCVELRKLILNTDTKISGAGMELVFGAMRLENQKLYREIGKNYDFIVSDRGWLSHLAYTDNNESVEFTKSFYQDFLMKITALPNSVIYLEADLKTSFARRLNRGEAPDAIEIKGEDFQASVKQSFDKYLETHRNVMEINRIDADDSLEGVRRQLDKIIKSYNLPVSTSANV